MQSHPLGQAALLLNGDSSSQGAVSVEVVALPACTILTNCRDSVSGCMWSRAKLPCCMQDGSNILVGTEDDPFIRGIRIWLKAHQHNTSTTAQLWEAMSSAVGRNVGTWMKGWSYGKGFPLVRVTLGGITGRDVSVSQVWTSSLGHC